MMRNNRITTKNQDCIFALANTRAVPSTRDADSLVEGLKGQADLNDCYLSHGGCRMQQGFLGICME